MKNEFNRGIRIQNRILISALLLILQLAFLFYIIYDSSLYSVWGFTLSMIVGAITSVFIINKRGNADHKITWIIFILIFPIFGISVYILWGGGRVLPHLRKKMEVCESHYKPYLKTDQTAINSMRYFDMPHSRQAEYLINDSKMPLYNNVSAEYLPSGERFFERLLEELKKAKQYIFIEFFIIAEGYMWDEIYSILKQKATEGVEIKIIFDDFGSIKRQRRGFLQKIRNDGIEISIFNPIYPLFNTYLNNRNHRKIVVIDGETAFTGGINIGDEYINREERFGHWMDSGIIIKGNAVTSFLCMFCTMWEFITGSMIDAKSHIKETYLIDDGFAIPYNDGPLNNNNPAEGIYSQILNSAQRYVYIMTPYLVIDDMMTATLCMAAKSGVDVCIITPHIPDKWYVHNVTQYNYLELLQAGVKIFEYTPGFIHSKVFLSDDLISTVGSVNMDYRSFVFHFECGVWLSNRKLALDIKQHFREILAVSQEITLEDWQKRPLKQRFKQAILHIFGPLM
jgi:cardiolipin synthase